MVDFPNIQAVTQSPPPNEAGNIANYDNENRGFTAKNAAVKLVGGLVSLLSKGTFFLMALVVLAEFNLDDPYKPTTVWAGITGGLTSKQIQATEQAQVALEKQLSQVRAEEQAKANTEYQAKIAMLQNELDMNRDAYNTLYSRANEFAQAYMMMQEGLQKAALELNSSGQIGSQFVRMFTNGLCAASRASNDGDADGYCAADQRVAQGSNNDLSLGLKSYDQLRADIFGGLPDPAPQRVRNPQTAQQVTYSNETEN